METMKKKQLFEIERDMGEAAAIKDFKISYAIQKNRSAIKSEIEAIREAAKPSKEFLEYAKICQKDPKADTPELREKYAAAIAEQEKKVSDTNEELEKTIAVDVYKVKLSYINGLKPEVKNEITSDVLNGIWFMIDEDCKID